MKPLQFFSLLFFIGFLFVQGCAVDPAVEPTKQIEFTVPSGWPQPQYKFENNEVTQAGFDLGKKLFFDRRLSRDNSVSCGSCHQPFAAFAQPDHDFSHGIDNRLGERNSPGLFNLNWHTGFFWDGGINHIELQPINPIQNPVEMDEKLDNVISKLKNDDTYKAMFKSAFGDETINSQRMLKAMAQFMGMLVSSNSKYDKYVRGETGGSMTNVELKGLNIFRENCASCHTEPMFSDFSYRNNGLMPSSRNDSGRGRITRAPEDIYKFKVPSLRNLKYTAPYMHDGRIKNLEAVLEYYATGIHHSPTLDPSLQNGIQLNPQDRSALIAFLNTLNDEEFVRDARFKEEL
ncbi:MAG TPA: cytochrome c peroxidase [Flavipsychrobacter sp.]|nr:cytochrome c peroxidase [Flavipsychrobacter sp.]